MSHISNSTGVIANGASNASSDDTNPTMSPKALGTIVNIWNSRRDGTVLHTVIKVLLSSLPHHYHNHHHHCRKGR